MKKNRTILVTAALPYANGDIHLGHILGYVQADIWARFQRAQGNQCYYICGTDAHGTPIMLRAQKEGISPEALIERMHDNQLNDFNGFHIHFDSFHTTHSPENKELTEAIYQRLDERGDMIKKTIQQAYDESKAMFLPDRFIKGECPKCGAVDQYGDSCEQCGATYDPLEMKNPVSVISGECPIQKESEHVFFNLPNYADFLSEWISDEKHISKTISNKLKEWFKTGLKPWDITRDAPYFGFEIPNQPNKYFYVWMDAPIGYIASFKHLCDQGSDMNIMDVWDKNSDAEIYHFIGKDVAYFHTIFWPAVLKGADYHLPNGISVHGFLTVNNQKMSKSRGTFIKANTYLKHLNPEYLRYYFASKVNSDVVDVDLNLEDFRQKVNSDLVGKLVNIASRTHKFIHQHFDGVLSHALPEHELWQHVIALKTDVINAYEQREYARAMKLVMQVADLANQYVNDMQPWVLAKSGELDNMRDVCTLALNTFRVLVLYLSPVMPQLAEKVSQFLNTPMDYFSDADKPLLNHAINPYENLCTRIDEETIKHLTEKTDD